MSEICLFVARFYDFLWKLTIFEGYKICRNQIVGSTWYPR